MSKHRQMMRTQERLPPNQQITNVPCSTIFPLAEIPPDECIVGTDTGQVGVITNSALAQVPVRRGLVVKIPVCPPSPTARYVHPATGLIQQIDLKKLIINSKWELAAAFDPKQALWVVAGKAEKFPHV